MRVRLRALAVTRLPAFWLLATAIFLAALDHGMLISHVLPILGDRGLDAGLAVTAAAFIGPMQVARPSRAHGGGPARHHPRRIDRLLHDDGDSRGCAFSKQARRRRW